MPKQTADKSADQYWDSLDLKNTPNHELIPMLRVLADKLWDEYEASLSPEELAAWVASGGREAHRRS